jgi:Flp pilus assembly protein TadG
MLRPLIRRPRGNADPCSNERGFTMALVALAIAVVISMAALSIDLGTLYQAKAEAQRAADAAALTAARVISISGITGDPTNSGLSWQPACGGAASYATLAAIQMAQQNLIGGVAVASASVSVLYGAGTAAPASADCTTVTNFAVNPTVTVSLQRANLPVFFARIFSLFGGSYSGSTVSATATAEAYNSSGAIPLAPVNPRCVKPWFVPNQDPGNGANNFVSPTTGSLQHGGIFPAGDIGETFTLIADCGPSGRRRGRCVLTDTPPVASVANNTLDYLPGQVLNASTAIAANSTIGACSDVNNNDFTKAVAGCDQSTVYACGNSLANAVDLTEDPGPPRHDSVNGVQCLINETANGPASGQDVLAPGAPTAPPYTYPFQIQAGANSALVSAGIASPSQITSSPSIVSLPIYDSNAVTTFTPPTTQVTVIGFLQVFINSATGTATTGTINVTVMNVVGCGNSYGGPPPPVALGTSPVPIRLITSP